MWWRDHSPIHVPTLGDAAHSACRAETLVDGSISSNRKCCFYLLEPSPPAVIIGIGRVHIPQFPVNSGGFAYKRRVLGIVLFCFQ